VKLFSVFIFAFLLFVGIAQAQDLEAEFFFDEKISSIKEGDVLVGTLRVWPLENAQKQEFTKVLNTNLFNSFFVSEIISADPSVNNADVFELKAKLVVLNKVEAEKMIFEYNGTSLHVKYHEVLFKPLENKSEEFYVLEQSLDKNWTNLIIGIMAAGILISLFVFKDKIKEKFKKENPKTQHEKYKSVFLNAKTRNDFEKIYKEKDIWLNLLEIHTPEHFDFFKTLNQFQYKKEWTETEFKEVQTAFEIIKESFK
jgi:hypothetical protein